MNSKVLPNEYKTEIENIGTLYYGSPNEKTCDVISMTLKGKFKPISESKNYEKNSARARHMFVASGTEYLNGLSWIDNHYIFTADFTEKGISYGKPNKYKYQLFVRPNKPKTIEEYKGDVFNLTTTLNGYLGKSFEENGFTFA